MAQATTDLGYDDRGTGPAVVLLHPFPFTRLIWAGFAETLAAHRRVIALDARGFGETPAPKGGAFSMDDLADDVATLLDRLGIARCTLLGQSMGGYAALAFAARYGDRLEGLVLCGTRATADSAEAHAGRATALATIRDAGVQAYLAASIPRQLMPSAPPARVAHLRARAETRAASLIAGVEALRDRPDRTGVLGALRCPTLVVCGDDDQISPPAEMKQMAAAIPGAVFAAVAEAGHISHVESPGGFERAVLPFLLQQGTRS
jgi:3-oxoadipate enol-lactonase